MLFDPQALASFCQSGAVISLRQFCLLGAAGWKDIEAVLVRERALVVAGLEGGLDPLDPTDAVAWLYAQIYPTIISFQRACGVPKPT